jgi:hypothetical protein
LEISCLEVGSSILYRLGQISSLGAAEFTLASVDVEFTAEKAPDRKENATKYTPIAVVHLPDLDADGTAAGNWRKGLVEATVNHDLR